MTDLERAIAVYHAVADAESARSLTDYLRRVVINCRPSPRRFGDVARAWQWERANAMTPALEQVAGLRSGYDGSLNFWYGAGKGADKSSFIARTFSWLLAYAKQPLSLYACAADTDQASLIRDAMEAELKLNPWLSARVNVAKRHAEGAGGRLEILASDAASGQGKLPDVVVADELTHWRNKDFFDAIYSARNKRPGCVFAVITNAGFRGTWQWELRNLAASSPGWHFFEQPAGVPLDSWMNAARITEDRKLLTPGEARRLLDNEWIDPGEENGFVSLAEAERCVDDSLSERDVGDPRFSYYLAVDYAPVRDRTALCVLHLEGEHAVVDRLDVWQGSADARVQIADVERWIDDRLRGFRVAAVVVDPYQLESTTQRLRQRGVRVEQYESRGGKRNYELANALRGAVLSRRVRWSPAAGRLNGETMASELAALVMKSMSYGSRIDHEHGGHDDRAVAVGMALVVALSDPRAAAGEPPRAIEHAKPSVPSLGYAQSRNLFGMR